jgi:hypothetical protein
MPRTGLKNCPSAIYLWLCAAQHESQLGEYSKVALVTCFVRHFSFGAQARAILESARSGDKIPKSPPDESVFILCSCISVFAYFSLLKGKPRHNIGRAQLWLEAIRVERLAGNEGIAQQVKLTENLLY